jgi:hypothetical protein
VITAVLWGVVYWLVVADPFSVNLRNSQ